MADIYNLTGWAAANTTFDYMTQANVLSDGVFGIGILVTFFVVMLLSFKIFEGKIAFAGASYLAACIALFLRILGLIDDWVLVLFIILAAMGTLILIFLKDG